MIEQILGLLIVAGIGLALGWRPHLSIGSFFELIGLILLGLLAFTTIGVLMGMLIGSTDAVQGIGFAVVLPLSFLAGTFVPISGMKPCFGPLASTTRSRPSLRPFASPPSHERRLSR